MLNADTFTKIDFTMNSGSDDICICDFELFEHVDGLLVIQFDWQLANTLYELEIHLPSVFDYH